MINCLFHQELITKKTQYDAVIFSQTDTHTINEFCVAISDSSHDTQVIQDDAKNDILMNLKSLIFAIFVVDSQTIFHTQCTGTHMNDLCTKFYMIGCNC